jgi:RNA recognition motif-containing protein
MALFVGLRDCKDVKDIKEDDLRTEFSRFGELVRCSKRSTCAFISFKNDADAEKAVAELHGKEWRGGKYVLICIVFYCGNFVFFCNSEKKIAFQLFHLCGSTCSGSMLSGRSSLVALTSHRRKATLNALSALRKAISPGFSFFVFVQISPTVVINRT